MSISPFSLVMVLGLMALAGGRHSMLSQPDAAHRGKVHVRARLVNIAGGYLVTLCSTCASSDRNETESILLLFFKQTQQMHIHPHCCF